MNFFIVLCRFRYQLSEVIDSQLKQMSEDLKEIVEHLNESNKNEDLSDPVSLSNIYFYQNNLLLLF